MKDNLNQKFKAVLQAINGLESGNALAILFQCIEDVAENVLLQNPDAAPYLEDALSQSWDVLNKEVDRTIAEIKNTKCDVS